MTGLRVERTIARELPSMKILTTVNRRCAIVYDGERIKDPSDSLFDPDTWARDGRLAGVIGGVVCLLTIPFVPVGMSILCAVVAVLVGVRR